MKVLDLGLCERKCSTLCFTPTLVAGGVVFLTLFSRLTTCFKNHYPFGKVLLPNAHSVTWVDIASRKPVLFDSQRLRHFCDSTNVEQPSPVGVEWLLGGLENRQTASTASSQSTPFIIRPVTYKELNVVAYIMACSFYGVKTPPIEEGCGSTFFTSLKVGNKKNDVCFTSS